MCNSGSFSCDFQGAMMAVEWGVWFWVDVTPVKSKVGLEGPPEVQSQVGTQSYRSNNGTALILLKNHKIPQQLVML